MRCPSDAQARLLALVADHEAEERAVEWNTTPDDGYQPSRARLYVETIDREADRARFTPADGGTYAHRVATVDACVRAGWLSGLHTRSLTFPPSRWHRHERTWNLTQLDTTEDGVIALGLWRERKLAAPPAELPVLSGHEREVAEIAQRAYELGYALCARKPARLEARRMRRRGWFTTCWVANHPYGLVPAPLALVEIRPDQADTIPTTAGDP